MRKKLLFLAEGILLLVLFISCFFGTGSVTEITNADLYREEETGELVSNTFALRPGVYRITVEADVSGGGIGDGMKIGLGAEQMTFHAIRGNEATLYAGTEYHEITYYVKDKVSTARIEILPFSEDAPTAYELKVQRTAAGNRIVLVLAVVFCALLDGLLYFHKKIMTGKVNAQKKWTVCALALFWVTACIPLMVDYLILGTDSVQCLKETEWLLRGEWSRIPVLHLLYLWIPAAMRRIGFPVMTAYKTWIAVLIAAAEALFYGVLSASTDSKRNADRQKDYRVVLLATALGLWNPLSMRMLYSLGNPGKFVLYALGYAVLCVIAGILFRRVRVKRKLSPWIVFAIALVLVLQVLYFENTLTFQSDVNYWYNEEPFMTGE